MWHLRSAAFIAILLSGSTPPLEVRADAPPCPRGQPVVAFHAKQRTVVMFGGYCGTTKKRMNDLWALEDARWVARDSSDGPPPRSGHAMAYDTARDRLIVFAGKNDEGGLLGDTWAWDGKAWSRIAETGPPARQSHRLVYNRDDGKIYLFGGSESGGQSVDDTWALEGDTWKRVETSESPPARLQHAMAYDAARKRIVLFGGFDRTEDGKTVYGDTWELDPAGAWTRKADQPSLRRDHHAMAYHEGLEQVVLFGGYVDRTYLGDTRAWDGDEWRLVSDDGPAPRAGKPGLVYDRARSVLVLYGGGNAESNALQDVWELGADGWARTSPPPGYADDPP